MADTKLFVRKQSGGIFTVVDKSFIPGSLFFVGSTVTAASDTAGSGINPDSPFATIDFAIGQCTADAGDVILVLPGHTEDVTAAAGIDFDVDGVSCIGLGIGAKRPLITFSGTTDTSDIDFAASNLLIENIAIDVTGNDSLAAPIDVDGADISFRNCLITLADAGGQADLCLVAAATADNLLIENCEFIGSTDAGCASAIQLTGTDRTTIRGCYIKGAFTTSLGGIDVDTTFCTFLDIDDNYVENLTASSTVCINLIASCTGVLRDNKLRVTNDGEVGLIDTPGNTTLIENYGVNNNGETGILLGTAST